MTDSADDRRARYYDWLNSLGFSAHDWLRIREHAEQTTPNFTPAALDDLSVPIRVGAVMKEQADRYSGSVLGSHHGRALLYWPMNEREREAWAQRRRGR